MWLRLQFLTAIGLVAFGLWQLGSAKTGLTVARGQVGATPVTVFRPVSDHPAPAIVIAHGFAGSQQLMQPFAVTLARNGYRGGDVRLPRPWAESAPLPAVSLTHAPDAGAVRIARRCRGIRAPPARGATGASRCSGTRWPPTSWCATPGRIPMWRRPSAYRCSLRAGHRRQPAQPAGHRRRARACVSARRGLPDRRYGGRRPGAQEGVTYGSFADGTARRLALADGVEHIGVLYSGESMAEALDWFNQTFGRPGTASWIPAGLGWVCSTSD